jgi:glycosyltransferase A (GT-A) superfamily protein (DUF2064 family)
MRRTPSPEAVHLLVIAKAPVPGRVKTRLCPPCTPVQAAALAEAALRDTLGAVAATPAARRTVVLDGPTGCWLPPGVGVLPQRGRGLDERLAAAFDDAWSCAPLPLLLVGMDTPQVTPALLGAAVRQLLAPGTDAVLGPALDGGWWALGLRRPDRRLLLGVPTSTAATGALQHDRLTAAALRVADLCRLTDVDNVADAVQVAGLCHPASHFAGAVGALSAGWPVPAQGSGLDRPLQRRR